MALSPSGAQREVLVSPGESADRNADTRQQAEYEFDTAQEEALADLARYIGGSGLSSWGIAAVCGAVSIVSFRGESSGLGFLAAVFAVYFVLAAFWVTRASNSLRAIVATRGRDQTHLLHAVNRLARYYRLKLWLLLAFLAIVLLTVVTPAAG